MNNSTEFIVIATFAKKTSYPSFENFIFFRNGDGDAELKPASSSHLFSFRSVTKLWDEILKISKTTVKV